MEAEIVVSIIDAIDCGDTFNAKRYFAYPKDDVDKIIKELEGMMNDADKAFNENGELRERIAELEKDRDFWKEAYEKECDRSYMLACDWWGLESTRVSDELLEKLLIIMPTHDALYNEYGNRYLHAVKEAEALLAERKENG